MKLGLKPLLRQYLWKMVLPPRYHQSPRLNAPPARLRARQSLAVFPLALAGLVAFIWTGAAVVRPDGCDPDYLARRDLLRERLRERPDARLAIVLGSSRTGLGFVPECLPTDNATLWFNLSHFGSGPVFLLVTLDRILRDGFRPDVLVIELMPAFVVKESPRLVGTHLTAGEVIATAEYGAGMERGWYYLRHRLILGNLRQAFDPVATIKMPRPLGGPPVLYDDINPAVRANLARIERDKYGRSIRSLEVSAESDQALRTILDRCEARGIRAILLLSPEGPSFRAVYNPDTLGQFREYLAALAGEKNAGLIDAREWLGEEDFFDSHHPLRRGAEAFTRRLVREAGAPPDELIP